MFLAISSCLVRSMAAIANQLHGKRRQRVRFERKRGANKGAGSFTAWQSRQFYHLGRAHRSKAMACAGDHAFSVHGRCDGVVDDQGSRRRLDHVAPDQLALASGATTTQADGATTSALSARFARRGL